MTINVKQNGHAPTPLATVDWVRSLSAAAWGNALRRRNHRPTMPNQPRPNKSQKVIQQGYEDGLYMAALWVAGLSISKAQMTAQGLSTARWYYARALLDMARMLDGKRRDRLATKDEATLRTRLETAFSQARAQPERFYARVPTYILRRRTL